MPNMHYTGNGSVRLNRTCQGCRQRKIKCVVHSGTAGAATATATDENTACERCLRLGLECIFPPPATRRARRRNETRLKELELQLEALQDAVSKSENGISVDSGSTSTSNEVDPSPSSNNTSHPEQQQGSPWSSKGTSTSSGARPHQPTIRDQQRHDESSSDPIDKGFISLASAETLYGSFYSKLAPVYPLVLPPEPSDWETVRRNRPALFRAILTSAASGVDPMLSTTLFQENEVFLAEEVVIKGRKSLDLIQALLVTSAWYQPPKRFQDLKFGQFANMAATILMDLKSSNDERYKISPFNSTQDTSQDMMETCRTFLACYFLCSSIALSFRRPSALRYGPWVARCIQYLEETPDAHVNDQRLASWVRLQILAEESLAVVGLDEGARLDFNDPRTRFILKECIEKVVHWRNSLAENVMNAPMEIHYHMILLSLREPSLHEGHSLSDFRPPYVIRSTSINHNSPGTSLEISQAKMECEQSARDLLLAFLALGNRDLVEIPVITYTRMMYAVVILIKLNLPGQAEHEGIPGRSAPWDILNRLIEKLNQAAGKSGYRVPATFSIVLSGLARWCNRDVSRGLDEEAIEPMMHLTLEEEEEEEESEGDKGGQVGSSIERCTNLDCTSAPQADEVLSNVQPDLDSFEAWNGGSDAMMEFWKNLVGDDMTSLNFNWN